MNISTPQPSFTRDIVRGFCIWGMGWFVFAIIEALLIITRTPALRFSTLVLTITAYAIAGAAGGMICCLHPALFRAQQKKQPQQFQRRDRLLQRLYYFYPAMRRPRHH